MSDSIGEQFGKHLARMHSVSTAKRIIEARTDSEYYLFGGFVRTTLQHILHGGSKPGKKFNFLITHEDFNGTPEPKWGFDISKEGFYVFHHRRCSFKVMPVARVPKVKEMKRPHTVEGFFMDMPYVYQRLAYCMNGEVFVGEGLKDIEDRLLRVNNPQVLIEMAERSGRSVSYLLRSKASELGYSVVE